MEGVTRGGGGAGRKRGVVSTGVDGEGRGDRGDFGGISTYRM